MTSKKSVISIASIIVIALVILTWPILSLQTKFEGGQSTFAIYYPDTAKLTVSVWNRGGAISSWHIITPESCISAIVSENATCTHTGFSGEVPCTTGICGQTNPQDSGPVDTMSIKFNNQYPSNFSIALYAHSSFSFIPISLLNENYLCTYYKYPTPSYYNCTRN